MIHLNVYYTFRTSFIKMRIFHELQPLISCIAVMRNVGRNIIRRKWTSTKKKSKEVSFPLYSVEQQKYIVEVLEKCVLNNETRPYLNERRLQSLKPLFKSNDKIQHLEHLLAVDGIGPKLLHRICDSILQSETPNESTQSNGNEKVKLSYSLIKPSRIMQSDVESVVSIHFGINTVSWTRLWTSGSSEDKVDSWDVMDLSEFNDKQYDVHTIWNLVLNVRSIVPDGDVYLMEDSNWSNVAKTKIPMKYHIQGAMLTTAICSIFNQIDSQGEPRQETTNRLYFIRTFTPSRLFNKIVGSERVSAQDIVLNMMEGGVDPRHRPIKFSDDVAERYLGLNGSLRDNMCRALLLAVSFAELILHCNPEAFGAIGKSTKAKKKKTSLAESNQS